MKNLNSEEAPKQEIHCDVAVIGGGPAGMMAAINAAGENTKVTLIEKNKTLGKKLLITGGGRCNITNAIFDNLVLSKKYGTKGKFLLSPFSKCSVRDVIEFFESRGMLTKTELENRVFPTSDSARSVFDVLANELERKKVTVLTDQAVNAVLSKESTLTRVETKDTIIHAKVFIFATGGTARPETGSSGDGFNWLKKLGHTIHTPSVALVPITTKEQWGHKLSGLSLQDVRATLFVDGVRWISKSGKMLFTHFGLSGPLFLNMSQAIGEAIREGSPVIEIDLFPTLDHKELDEKLRNHLTKVQNKKWANALAEFLPAQLATQMIELSTIDMEVLVNKISRESRLDFVKQMKSLKLTPTGLLGTQKAIVSSGGVRLEEVDFKTMRSTKIRNLYLTGDLLDFDRPSGGFSLQICWATGLVAGQSATQAVQKKV